MDMREMVAIKDKVTLTIPEAAEYSNIGQNKLNELIQKLTKNVADK